MNFMFLILYGCVNSLEILCATVFADRFDQFCSCDITRISPGMHLIVNSYAASTRVNESCMLGTLKAYCFMPMNGPC